MDPLSGVTSVLAILQVAAKLVKTSRQLCQDIKHAPEELHALAAQLALVETELSHLHMACKQGHPLLVTTDTCFELYGALTDARQCLFALEVLWKRNQRRGNFSSRALWALRDRQDVENALTELRSVKDRIGFQLQILSFRSSSFVLTGITEVKSLLMQRQGNAPVLEKAYQGATSALQRSQIKPKIDRRVNIASRSFGSKWTFFGVSGSIIPTTVGPFKDYFFTTTCSLPLTQLFSAYALRLDLVVRTLQSCPLRYELGRGSSFSVARILRQDDPFFAACGRGDLLEVRQMLSNGNGRVTDIEDQNLTPLAYAIRSGNSDVVHELLDNGADIDARHGTFQTTPLQWALWYKEINIVRILLSRGASQDHINRLGWNLPFFCWSNPEPTGISMLPVIRLLDEDDYQNLKVVDRAGWTVLHRVAAFGMAEEVKELLRLGASVTAIALPLGWNAMHHAVFYGNYAAFNVLLDAYDEDVMTSTDVRGWTLLHIAASAGHEKIVHHLLDLGSDPDAVSRPFRSHMPDSLFDRAVTPQEAAAAQGNEREELYLRILRETTPAHFAGEQHLVKGLEEQFEDALEFL